MHKEHAKKIKNTRCLKRGLKAPSMRGKCVKRIESTRHMLRVQNKDQQYLVCIEHTHQGSRHHTQRAHNKDRQHLTYIDCT